MPAVTELSKPNGEPIATTHSPGEQGRVAQADGGQAVAVDFQHGHVGAVSAPTNFALYSRLSVVLTVISSALATTWALVAM